MNNKEREKILKKIYKICFIDPDVMHDLRNDWFYIYQLLCDDKEDEIPDVALEMIDTWLDGY